jgi:TonB family protein
MKKHVVPTLATALSLPFLLSGASAEEPALDESLLGCGWSAEWRVPPADSSGVSAKRSPAKKIRHVNPKWPKDRVGRTGSGAPVVEAVVDDRGKVVDARVVRRPDWKPRSWPELDEAILAAVRKWEYTPEELDGRPVPTCLTVTVDIHWR